MTYRSKTDRPRQRLSRPSPYRPMVESLEDRLPPGDVLLGRVLSSAWFGQGAAGLFERIEG